MLRCLMPKCFLTCINQEIRIGGIFFAKNLLKQQPCHKLYWCKNNRVVCTVSCGVIKNTLLCTLCVISDYVQYC